MHSQNHFSHRRNLDSLLHSTDDDSGYVEGKVFMIWPPRNRLHRINLEVVQGSTLYRFEVEVPHKDGIAFRPHERVCLALKGMRVDRRMDSSAPHNFPVILRFPDGIVLKYLTGNNAGKVVNTWDGNTDEWYNPGMVHTVSDAVTVDASEVHHAPVPKATDISVNLSTPIADDAAIAPSEPLPGQIATERPGRKAHRRKQKLLRRKEKLNGTDKQPPPDVVTPWHGHPQTSIQPSTTNVSDNHPQLHQVSDHAKGDACIRENDGIDVSRKDDHNGTVIAPEGSDVLALQLKAGIRTQRGDIFTAIIELQKGHSMVNVIGVVTHATLANKTRTNEWSRSITLTDPSIFDSPRQTIKVNCFQKKYPEWLPQVQKDDIVILRKLKITEYKNDVTGTGYGDKLRWAIYNPLTHSIRPPDKGNAPEKESIDDGMGYEYCPYWEPFRDSVELEYCRKIGEWWRAKRTFEEDKVSAVECSRSISKQHLLISEASPDLPPDGFFNCTVEVLQKFNNGAVTTIYVTDYTASTLCNMWDNAKNIAMMMNPGEYWYLHNVRARWNPNHYMEGTMQLAEKVTQLDEAKLETHLHFKTFLARRREFKLNQPDLTPESASLHVFPEMLLQDVEENTSFITCVVELLHMDLDSRDGHFLYVTDYTYNPDLPTAISTSKWARNLGHCVVKIKLDDVQAKNLSNLVIGSTYIIRNMRIKRSSVSSGMYGCLGGGDTLVVPLHDSSSNHNEILHRNKAKWRRENVLSVPMLSDVSYGVAHLANVTSLEALSWSAPATFRILARTVDFFPFSLEDACVLRCTKCKSSPPSSFQRCPRCDDMMETHCKWFYCLYILLEDKNGDELIVSLSGKECTLLQDVDPADFRRDQVAFCKFLAKLDPMLGNLRDIHLAWSKNENKAIDSPLMIFTLESWNVGNEKGYGLLDCVSVS